jgi:hypothetical protein
MPGIDGTGLAAYRQFPRLTRAFDLRCLIIPRTDRSTFDELTDFVAVRHRLLLDAGRSCSLPACCCRSGSVEGFGDGVGQVVGLVWL